MAEENKKRKLLVMEEGSVEEEKAEVRATALQFAKQGNLEGVKILQDLHLQERYDALISNVDNDEYEFAG